MLITGEDKTKKINPHFELLILKNLIDSFNRKNQSETSSERLKCEKCDATISESIPISISNGKKSHRLMRSYDEHNNEFKI